MLFDTISEASCENTTTPVTTSTTSSSTTTTAATTSSTTTCAPVPIPTFSPASGAYVAFPVDVTISGGGSIRYTLDGSTPDLDSPLYTGPVTVAEGQTIKAIVVAEGCGECTSDVAAATYNNSVTTTTSACPQEYNSIIPDITQFAVSYFAGGANLPAGLYQVTYVEGALKYIGSDNYQVNRDASHGYRVIHSSGTFQQESAPVGIYTAYSTQAALETALGGDTVVFSHSGGSIGMFLADNYYGDNVAGAPNPTFLLTRLCPTTTTTTTPTTTTTTTAAPTTTTTTVPTTTTTTTAAPTTTTTTVPTTTTTTTAAPTTTTTTTTAPGYTQFSPINLTSNTSDPNFTASASTDNTHAYYCFDNPASGLWWQAPTAALPNQVTLQMAVTKICKKYSILPGTTALSPNSWTFKGSNDGISWATLDTQAGINSWVASTPKEFVFSNSTSYTYYRLNISVNNAAGVCYIDTLRYYESP